jgi:hypothetical protein
MNRYFSIPFCQPAVQIRVRPASRDGVGRRVRGGSAGHTGARGLDGVAGRVRGSPGGPPGSGQGTGRVRVELGQAPGWPGWGTGQSARDRVPAGAVAGCDARLRFRLLRYDL